MAFGVSQWLHVEAIEQGARADADAWLDAGAELLPARRRRVAAPGTPG